MSLSEVRQGQQYYSVECDSVVWQVLSVYADPSGIPHARMSNVERPYEFKTLTCSVLGDPLYYRHLSDRSDRGAATKAIRSKLPRKRSLKLGHAA